MGLYEELRKAFPKYQFQPSKHRSYHKGPKLVSYKGPKDKQWVDCHEWRVFDILSNKE